MQTFKYMMLYKALAIRSSSQLLAQQVTSLNNTSEKSEIYS